MDKMIRLVVNKLTAWLNYENHFIWDKIKQKQKKSTKENMTEIFFPPHKLCEYELTGWWWLIAGEANTPISATESEQ